MLQYKTLPEKPFVISLQEGKFMAGYGSQVVFPHGKMMGNCEIYPIWADDGKTIVFGRKPVNFEVNKQFQVVIPFGDSVRGIPASSLILILDESNPYVKRLLNFKGSHDYMDMQQLNVRQYKQINSLTSQLDQVTTNANAFYQKMHNVMGEMTISKRGAKQTTDVQEALGGLMQNRTPQETTIE